MTKDEALQILDTIPTISEQVDALEMAIKALEQEPSDTVSRGAYEQVMWERDVAIGQLKELGYGLGQKVEPCDAISRQAALNSLIDNTHLDGYDLAEALDAIENKEKLPPVTQIPIECDDAISREDAEQMFRNIRCHLKLQDYKLAEEFNTRDLMLLNAEQMIHALPSVTQKPGKWIRWREEVQRGTHCTENIPHCKCSECGKEYDPYSSHFIKYCNECGVKMQEVEDNG